MSKKLKRSAVALVLAATMVFSSQGVLTAFAVGENETSTAVDVSALEPILDKEETVVVEEPGNTDETETPEVEVCEECQGVNGNHAETCPHYVDPNTPPENPTDDENNNNQEQQECTCGAEEGQPHEEGCPLYEEATIPECTCGAEEGQPHEEGCPLYEEPTVPECTCGAEEGQPHEEGCPLYEENTEDTEDTQEPSEEDVAAVQAVVDVINSLPTTDDLANYTPTIELKPEDEGYQDAYQAALDAYYSQVQEKVKAARAAYDALTEEQKAAFDATVLAKLTALEELIAMREQADVLPEDAVTIIDSSISNETFNIGENQAIVVKGSADSITTISDSTFNLSGTTIYINGSGVGYTGETSTKMGIGDNVLFKNCAINVLSGQSANYSSGNHSAIGLFGKANFENCTITVSDWTGHGIGFYGDANVTFTESSLSSDGVKGAWSYAMYGSSVLTLDSSSMSATNMEPISGNINAFYSGDLKNNYDAIYIKNHSSVHFYENKGGGFAINSINIHVDDSEILVENNNGSASNSGYWYVNDSTLNMNNNFYHGLSAEALFANRSNIILDKNGYYGAQLRHGFIIDGDTSLQVTGNSYNFDCAGLKLTAGVTNGLVEAGATVNITDNYCSGLSNNGVCEFEEGVKLTITGNDNDKGTSSHGGGIYNSGNAANLTLPSDAVIYNNHADTAGDDIFNNTTSTITFGKVGSDWVLDDCNHTITGWFDDSANSRWNAHTGPVHAELYEDATTAVTGVLALKAAHPYQYDPDAPTEPSEPVDWETSKSKTATNLDENYESQVTLSLPAAETVPVTDVVFVLDRSSSAGAARQEISDMMDNLLEIVNNSDAVINVGVVNFWYKADSGIELTALTSESIDSIKNAIMEGNLSGTNIEAGIDAAVAMLDASSTPAENKYMVLVTDGISHAWNDQNGEVKTIWGQGTADYSVVFNGANSYYYFDTTKTSFQTVFDTPSGDTQLNSNYEVPVFDAESVIEVLEDTEYADYYIRQGEYESYYSGVEKGVYEAAHAYANAASKYKCINLYWEVSGYPIASEFMEWTNEQGKCYNISDDLSGAFDEVEREITYVVDAGSQVIDVIGGDDDGVNYDYDFDFVDVVSLTVGGEELDFTKDGNTYYFGESRDGIYPFVLTYYPNGLGVATMDIEDETVVAGELFVWEINVPITIDKSVQLTYTVKLANPKTADGTYGQYDEDGSENYAGLYTNNSAVLFPVDSNGNVGEKEAFDKPTVSYTVSNGKPVEPTPDPDPDPDRPSRPNRDDDDDWEPLPDAPVKDKPTTEVDVPEETETPTTEQPDKYNPETGDTTTVFAAMALAAVSLGGVVLLGRKKK